MAAEAPAQQGNLFTRHIGPLPMWAWLGIVGGGVLLWAWWSNRNSSASSTTSASTQPPFINQVYTNQSPPSTDHKKKKKDKKPSHLAHPRQPTPAQGSGKAPSSTHTRTVHPAATRHLAAKGR